MALIDAHEKCIQAQTSESNCAHDHDEQDALENVGLHQGEWESPVVGWQYDSSGILYAGESFLWFIIVYVCVYVDCAQGVDTLKTNKATNGDPRKVV